MSILPLIFYILVSVHKFLLKIDMINNYIYYQKIQIQRAMDPNENEEFESSPREEDFSKMTEAEREAEFRRKRQEYVAEKMARKKEMMRMKRQEFGSSSSDQSDQDVAGSRSSKSSRKKSQPKQLQQKTTTQTLTEATPKKIVQQQKYEQITPKKMSESLERIAVNVPVKKGNQWVKDVLVIGEKTIIIQNITQQYKNFTKVKIIADAILGCPYRIKINCSSDQQILFAVSGNEEKMGLPSHYYVFAKLIQEKLLSTGIKLKQNIQQKLQGAPQSLLNGSIKYGKICKKSQILGNWEQRLVVINKEGIFSYKKLNQKHTMYIPYGTINELWTRLEVQDSLLIVKIWYSGKKTQFGFPLADYLSPQSWLYAFYTMMSRGK